MNGIAIDAMRAVGGKRYIRGRRGEAILDM
jgi:hypothetical protein